MLPKRLCDNERFMKDLAAKRLANASKMGVTCLELQCTPEVVGMLEEDVDYSQWPIEEDVCHACEDVPREVASSPSFSSSAQGMSSSSAGAVHPGAVDLEVDPIDIIREQRRIAGIVGTASLTANTDRDGRTAEMLRELSNTHVHAGDDVAAAEELRAADLLESGHELGKLRAEAAVMVRERSYGAMHGAGELTITAAKAQFTSSVISLLTSGYGGDVPNLGSFKSASMRPALNALDEAGLPYDDLSNPQLKCGAWLVGHARTAAPVAGSVSMRRQAYGTIRCTMHKLVEDWRVARPSVTLEEAMAIAVVPLFTLSVESATHMHQRAKTYLRMRKGEDPSNEEIAEIFSCFALVPMTDEVAGWAPAKMDAPARIEVGLPPPPEVETLPLMGTPVPPTIGRVLADYRVNLTVHYDERHECVSAEGVYDSKNEVLYVPARVDLRPFEKWLPFALQDAGHTATSGGMLMHRPGVIAAAGPTKADGSPNMSVGANIRVRDMLKPPVLRFPRARGRGRAS